MTSASPAAVELPVAAGRRHRSPILIALAVGLGYFILARLALEFVAKPSGIAAIWPANGLTLGAILVARRRLHWVGLLAATFLANVAANLVVGRAPGAWMAYTLINVVEVLAAAAGMAAVFGRRQVTFASVREVIAFTAIAAVGAAGLAGLLGAAVAVGQGAPSFWAAWRLWAIVDALGLIVVTPVVVTLTVARPASLGPTRAAEAGLCLGLLATAALVVFGGPGEPTVLMFNFPYVGLLPFLLWAGLRFEPWLAALVVAVMVSISGWNTVHGNGPMIQPGFGIVESVITLQASTMLWGVSGLVLAAVTAERKSAAAALAASERRARAAGEQAASNHARLQALFDHTTALMSTKTRDGRYTQMNAALLALLGKSLSDVVGKTDHDLWPGPPAENARARDQEVYDTGSAVEYEVNYSFDGLSPRVYQATKFPVRDADGSITGVCVVSTDITARKQEEDQLRSAKSQAEEAREQAEASREQAESANRAKSEFLANISHEIRTPLTSIFGYADLLAAPSVSPTERLDHVQTIRRNGEHLLAILNDVLDMSKIEAGRMTVEQVATPVPPLVADVLSLMRQRALAKYLTLEVGCRTPVPAIVQSDPTRLRQVLLNVVGNAVKFTEAGRVAVDLWFDESHRRPELVVEVTDTGIGMSADQVASLGKPFQQGDPGHARRFGGSGLGMSISYRLAELMGGSITCQSQPGAGTTFTVRVPTGEVAGVPRVNDFLEVTGDNAPPTIGDTAFATSPTSAAAAAAAAEPKPLSGRVLVAEDAPDTRRLLLIHLRRAGLEAEIAENGQVAVARAVGAVRAGRPFDLILMDVQMPQMDGLTATGVLRSHGYTGRIVALTANAMEADRQRCVAAGCDGFLTKPIPGPTLIAAVAEQLAKGPSDRVGRAGDALAGGADDGSSLSASASASASGAAAVGEGEGNGAAGTESAAAALARGPGGYAEGADATRPRRLVSEMADDPDVGPLLAEYLHELREKVSLVERALAAAEWTEVGRLAHQIKGSAGGYGYPTLTHAAAALEKAVKTPAVSAAVTVSAAEMLDLCRQATAPQ